MRSALTDSIKQGPILSGNGSAPLASRSASGSDVSKAAFPCLDQPGSVVDAFEVDLDLSKLSVSGSSLRAGSSSRKSMVRSCLLFCSLIVSAYGAE